MRSGDVYVDRLSSGHVFVVLSVEPSGDFPDGFRYVWLAPLVSAARFCAGPPGGSYALVSR